MGTTSRPMNSVEDQSRACEREGELSVENERKRSARNENRAKEDRSSLLEMRVSASRNLHFSLTASMHQRP